MKHLHTIGRIIFGIPFAIFGINHFIGASNMAGMVPSFIPGGIFWVYLVGAGLIASSISLFSNKYVFLSQVLTAGMLLVFILTIHIPAVTHANASPMAIVGLMKDLGLLGAALFIAGVDCNKKQVL